jgi:hypothetical protein
MNVKHGRDGHVHVAGVQGGLAAVAAQAGEDAVGVEHELAVAEEHPLGHTGGAGGEKVVAMVFSSKSGKS